MLLWQQQPQQQQQHRDFEGFLTRGQQTVTRTLLFIPLLYLIFLKSIQG